MRLLAGFITAVLLVTVAVYSAEKEQSAVVGAMQARRRAEAQGDAGQWEKMVAPDCVWIEPNGRIKRVADHRPKAPNSGGKFVGEVTLSDEIVRDYGDLAVLTYREEVRTKVATEEIRTVVRYSETYRKVDSQWLMVHSVETPIVERSGAKVSTDKFNDYVGEYEMAPGMVGIVAWDGKTLTLFSKGWKQPYELVPLTENRFFVRQFETTEITFVRDVNGKVTHQTSESPNQPVLTAKKIK